MGEGPSFVDVLAGVIKAVVAAFFPTVAFGVLLGWLAGPFERDEEDKPIFPLPMRLSLFLVQMILVGWGIQRWVPTTGGQ